tara:strand:- start:6569 stop:7846 length:1278 start_codon:yes stop_codon:yes gene_type:complete
MAENVILPWNYESERHRIKEIYGIISKGCAHFEFTKHVIHLTTLILHPMKLSQLPPGSLHFRFAFVCFILFTFGWVGISMGQMQYRGLKYADDVIELNNLFIDSLSIQDTGKVDSIAEVAIQRFKDVSDKLLLTTGVLLKSHSLTVENVRTGKKLYLSPTGSTNIGFGVNYQWFGIAFSFGLPASSSDKAKYGETTKHDFRLNLYTDAIVFQGHLQRYRGFHVNSVEQGGKKIKGAVQTPIVTSLETYSLGFSSWYFFNNKKFSYKAAYLRNAVQLKSAGSLVAGLFYSLDLANAETPFAQDLPDSINVDFDVIGYRSRSVGISVGYTYTLVIKEKFFVNATMVPGIGLKNVNLYTEINEVKLNDGFIGRLAFNFSMGYEAKHFLMGLRTFNSNRFVEANGYRITPTTNSVLLYVGKRFNIKKRK